MNENTGTAPAGLSYCKVCGRFHEGDLTACPTPSPQPPPRVPHRCPVCNGQKHLSTPPWVVGDVPTWSAQHTGPYPCPACDATGIVWG